MVDKQKPAAFMSYVNSDDIYGRLTQFRERLSDEVRVHIGEEFSIFQDRKDILWGQNWKERIEESLDEVTFLIPIITPSFFNSSACRDELQRFIERENELGLNDLILPVYYVDCPLLNDVEKRAGDELAHVIAAHQYADWRDMRFEQFTSPQVGKMLAQLAAQIRDALERVQALQKTEIPESAASITRRLTDTISFPLPTDIESVIESREPAWQPTVKSEPPTRVRDNKLIDKVTNFMDADDVFEFYRTEFVPAYSDLVGYIGDKPAQMLIELENTFAHMAQYFNPELDTQYKDKNLAKAYDNLARATLDCYKLLWVTIYEQLSVIEEDKYKRKLGFNISKANISKTEFRTKFQKLRKLAQEARGIEMTSVGLSPITALDKYKEVVKGGYELICTVDENKI